METLGRFGALVAFAGLAAAARGLSPYVFGPVLGLALALGLAYARHCSKEM